MKKKIIKKIILALIPIMVFCIGMNDVKADNIKHGYSSSYYDECVDNHTCVLMCAYENTVNTDTYSSYIYYELDNNNANEGNITIGYIQMRNEVKLLEHTDSDILFEADAFHQLVNEGVCPETGYVVNNKKCFGSKTYCDGKSNWFFNDFSKSESTKKYDINDQIKIYYDNWTPDVTSCDALRKQQTDNIQKELEQSLIDNFFYGHSPTFFGESNSIDEGIETANKKYENYTSQCDAEVDEQLANGEITQAEADELKSQNQAGLEYIKEQLKDFKDNLVIDKDISIKNYSNCEDLIGEDLMDQLNGYMTIIRILIPILLIVFGMVDFGKAVLAQDEQNMKKAQSTFMKRLIIGVIIFFVPTIINLLLHLANYAWPSITGQSCNI